MEDTLEGGLKKYVDIEKLRNKYSPTAFAMLYMCQFVDSKDAVLKFSARATWDDFDLTAALPERRLVCCSAGRASAYL